MESWKRVLIICTCAAFFCTAIVSAQDFRGAITGRVSDTSGGRLPGATITATNVATNVGSTTTANNDGSYTIPYLNPGVYRVDAELSGFKKLARENVDVRIGDRLVLDLTLEATTSVYPGYPRRLELTGSEGTVILDGDRLVATDLRARSSDLVSDTSDTSDTKPVNVASPVVADVSGHRMVIEDFIRAVAEKRPPLVDGAAGRASVAVIEAIYRSSKLQVPVEME